jgi:hypothetical protein
MDRARKREIGFVDKFIHAHIANHYDSDGPSSLHTIAQSKSGYLKIREI